MLTAGGVQAQSKKKGSKKGKDTRVEVKSTKATNDNEKKADDNEMNEKENEKYFIGTVIYNASLMDKSLKEYDEINRLIEGHEYNGQPKLPVFEGEEMIYAYDTLEGYFEYRTLRIRYNLKENLYIIAFKPDTSLDTYFSRALPEDILSDKGLMALEFYRQRLDGIKEEADYWRNKTFRPDGIKSTIADIEVDHYEYELPEERGMFWAVAAAKVTTWSAPLYGFDYILADALITIPIHNISDKVYHIQVKDVSTNLDRKRFEQVANGVEIDWPRMREMLQGNIKEWK